MTSLVLVFLVSSQLVGGEFTYTVQKGDSLTAISARFGVDARVLAEANRIRTPDRLQPGQVLNIDNRHIAPSIKGAEIVVNIPQRMLFHFGGAAIDCGCPIAAGKPGWQTPVGFFKVIRKEEHPTWDVPVSIQEETRKAGKPVLTHVPPSPENPLGEFWIGLSLDTIGIHGTNAPSSIYKLVTHGCIRLQPDDIRRLFPKIEAGTGGRIIYEPALVARTGSSVFVEIHPDVYKKGPDPLRKILETAASEGFLDILDLALVKEAIRKHDGIARDVTRRDNITADGDTNLFP